MTIILQVSVFTGKEEDWLEFIVKLQAFLSINGCADALQTNFKSKLHYIEDEDLDVRTELGKHGSEQR